MTDLACSISLDRGAGPGLWGARRGAALDLAAKDSVGMAYSASSRIWYTISHGILNEIYYPTIDRPQTRDMEFLLTDGETFVHEEKRDLDTNFEYIDSDALAVTAHNARSPGPLQDHQGDHRRSASSVVLMRVRLEGDERLLLADEGLRAAGAAS